MENAFDLLLQGKAIRRGGLYLYRYDDAITLINLCTANNLQVFGIDTFFVSDGYTHPIMEHSIDLSNMDASEANIAACRFLDSRKNLDFVYEIVY